MKALFACLALCACSAVPQTHEVSIPLRNPTVPISAITRFDFAAFSGAWDVALTYGGWHPFCFVVNARTQVWREGSAEDIQWGRVSSEDTGRLTLRMQDGTTRALWILWVDEGHNTAAIGTPDGSFGFVAARRGMRRFDQTQAAEKVMVFNGYSETDWGVPIGADCRIGGQAGLRRKT